MFTVATSSQVVKEELNFSLSQTLPGIGPILQDLSLNFYISADYTKWIILGVILLIFLLYRPQGIIPEPKSNNETYLSLLTDEERADSDNAVLRNQSTSEQSRLQSQFADNETEVS